MNLTEDKAKYKNSWTHWVILLIVLKLFGLIVWAHYWAYKIDMSFMYSK